MSDINLLVFYEFEDIDNLNPIFELNKFEKFIRNSTTIHSDPTSARGRVSGRRLKQKLTPELGNRLLAAVSKETKTGQDDPLVTQYLRNARGSELHKERRQKEDRIQLLKFARQNFNDPEIKKASLDFAKRESTIRARKSIFKKKLQEFNKLKQEYKDAENDYKENKSKYKADGTTDQKQQFLQELKKKLEAADFSARTSKQLYHDVLSKRREDNLQYFDLLAKARNGQTNSGEIRTSLDPKDLIKLPNNNLGIDKDNLKRLRDLAQFQHDQQGFLSKFFSKGKLKDFLDKYQDPTLMSNLQQSDVEGINNTITNIRKLLKQQFRETTKKFADDPKYKDNPKDNPKYKKAQQELEQKLSKLQKLRIFQPESERTLRNLPSRENELLRKVLLEPGKQQFEKDLTTSDHSGHRLIRQQIRNMTDEYNEHMKKHNRTRDFIHSPSSTVLRIIGNALSPISLTKSIVPGLDWFDIKTPVSAVNTYLSQRKQDKLTSRLHRALTSEIFPYFYNNPNISPEDKKKQEIILKSINKNNPHHQLTQDDIAQNAAFDLMLKLRDGQLNIAKREKDQLTPVSDQTPRENIRLNTDQDIRSLYATPEFIGSLQNKTQVKRWKRLLKNIHNLSNEEGGSNLAKFIANLGYTYAGITDNRDIQVEERVREYMQRMLGNGIKSKELTPGLNNGFPFYLEPDPKTQREISKQIRLETLKRLKDSVVPAAKDLLNGAPVVTDRISNAFYNTIQNAPQSLRDSINDINNAILYTSIDPIDSAKNSLNYGKQLYNAVIGQDLSDLYKTEPTIQNFVDKTANGYNTGVNAVKNGFDLAKTGVNYVTDATKTGVNYVTDATKTGVNYLGQQANNLGRFTTNTWNGMVGFGNTIMDKLKSFWPWSR